MGIRVVQYEGDRATLVLDRKVGRQWKLTLLIAFRFAGGDRWLSSCELNLLSALKLPPPA